MGASTGIGKALAINYASDNTILGLAARRIELLEELKKECELRNCETFIYENDVNIPLHCEISAQDFIRKAKGIDIIIANSGVCLLYTSPSPRDLSTSRMPSSA